MWTRDQDTGKWGKIVDRLPKDNYDSLKQDQQSVKLLSKCLSGSSYLTITSLDNIWSPLNLWKGGYWIDNPGNPPAPFLINSGNIDQFLNKFLKEEGFSIKNLFNPEQLIEDQNILEVDIATTESININEIPINFTIDGVRLKSGQRVLVKDQKSRITLSTNQDPNVYFSVNEIAATWSMVDDNVTNRVYEWNNEENGIYLWENNRLTRTTDLEDYNSVYNLSINVKLGNQNFDKLFNLLRLPNGYFPVSGENMFFIEGDSWVLRNRVDYKNILENNYYSIISHGDQIYFDKNKGFTFSIPEREVIVGDFGTIIVNQDNKSHIIPNKNKSNLKFITEVSGFYWVCGSNGTLLKIHKGDLITTQIKLETNSQLNSINFFNELWGVVVGDFNTIFVTSDGGINWDPIMDLDFSGFSFKSVIYYEVNKIFIVGNRGNFFEINNINGNWGFRTYKIEKQLESDDLYELVDDINDLKLTRWTNIVGKTWSNTISSPDFSESLEFHFSEENDQLKIELNSQYFTNPSFSQSEYLISLKINTSLGDIIYENPNYGSINYGVTQSYDFYQGKTQSYFSLPLDDQGNNKEDTYSINFNIYYNWDVNQIIPGYIENNLQEKINVIGDDIFLLSSNYNNLITFDPNNFLSNNFKFRYFNGSASFGDIKNVSRRPQSKELYINGNNIYKINLNNFLSKRDDGITNVISGSFSTFSEFFSNSIYTRDNLYLSGNNSQIKSISWQGTQSDLDQNFLDNLKSKLVYLDYDMASKLSFFDKDSNYRLPTSVTFSSSGNSFNTTFSFFSVNNIQGELNWLNYYKDSEKTFKYLSSLSDSNKILFSTTFSGIGSSAIIPNISVSTNDIFLDPIPFLPIAPSLDDDTKSKYTMGSQSIASQFNAPNTSITFSCAMIYDDLIILKPRRNSNFPVNEGDVLRLTSNVVDANLIVNRIERYLKINNFPNNLGQRITNWPITIAPTQSVDTYIYCYNTFNDSISKSLKKVGFRVTNLNKFNNVRSLVSNFNIHPVSIGYKLTNREISGSIGSSNFLGELTIEPRFNNNTSYYNLQSLVNSNGSQKEMKYSESFLNFGFSPKYNLLDYLKNIDDSLFNESTIFTIMPHYYNLVGNRGNSAASNNIYIDLNEGLVSGTESYYISGTNKIIFGNNYKFNWDSILINTFIDLKMVSTTGVESLNERLLVQNKYYDPNTKGWVMEFNKKIEVENPNNFDVDYFNILSRRTLSQISSDLSLVNKIQTLPITKEVIPPNSFTSLEKTSLREFNQDSYAKIIGSDNNVRELVSALIYRDSKNRLSMNVLNVEKTKTFNILNTQPFNVVGFSEPKLGIYLNLEHNIKIGDFVYIDFISGSESSQPPQYFGWYNVIDTGSNFVVVNVNFLNQIQQNTSTLKLIKGDSFFNYQPIDLFNLGSDKKLTRSIEIFPENWEIKDSTHNIVNLDLNKFKFNFVDGISLTDINRDFSWILEAEISNALIGRDQNGLVWYSGIWRCGRWFDGTWYSGDWLSGDWYSGTWNSNKITINGIQIIIDNKVTNDTSKWYGGRWFGGIWNGGTWFNGRRYSGDWNDGIWHNGIWNDGTWKSGTFRGGVWVLGRWEKGTFNGESNQSYWLDGEFISGDFENGAWYNGNFGNNIGLPSRFGTKSQNSRISEWNGGKWINGDFHSYLVTNSKGDPQVSNVHKYSIWKTGTWLNGNFWGGIAYNIDFRSGIWHGGILEEIQVVGVDRILPATQSNNAIKVRGLFKFNPGDEIWIIDDDRNGSLSKIGSNSNPKKWRINKIEEDFVNENTKLFLNTNLSLLGISPTIANQNIGATISVETGLRVVSSFKDVVWESGIWTNGIFDGGEFKSGIWYNGLFLKGEWGK